MSTSRPVHLPLLVNATGVRTGLTANCACGAKIRILRHFVGVLRLLKDGNSIMEYDAGEGRNLFDFREPKKVALRQHCPLVSGGLTSGQCILVIDS